MAPESYRALLAVLYDKASAAHLHHCRVITEPLIVALAALPRPLRRPAIFKLFDDIDGMDRFVAGLRFMCDRADVAFDRFAEELGALNQAEQVRAKIAALAEALPLPDRLPSPRLGAFHRIDAPAQIRSLARLWQNCLAEYLHEVNEGTTLIYPLSTKSLLQRLSSCGRTGWAGLSSMLKDPKTAISTLRPYRSTTRRSSAPAYRGWRISRLSGAFSGAGTCRANIDLRPLHRFLRFSGAFRAAIFWSLMGA